MIFVYSWHFASALNCFHLKKKNWIFGAALLLWLFPPPRHLSNSRLNRHQQEHDIRSVNNNNIITLHETKRKLFNITVSNHQYLLLRSEREKGLILQTANYEKDSEIGMKISTFPPLVP